MKYITSENFHIEEPTAVCIGKFEGLHLGHRSLIEEVKRQGYPTLLLAFQMENRHGLFTDAERRQIAAELGVDIMVAYPFSEDLRKMSPEEFVQQILVSRCQAAFIAVGEDFRFGYKRRGTAELLQSYGEKSGFAVSILPKKTYGNEVISSSRIKTAILEGNCEEAKEMLGFPYFFSGRVVWGNQIGRTLEMPTANLFVPERKLIPPFGVYASITEIDGKAYPGVTNIGKKPTIKEYQEIGVETFLFDFDKDIYGKEIRVKLYRFLRPEQKFSGLDELKKNMFQDKENARSVLKHLAV
ncbi:MAG: bifunctional riboflavin kinase/FAD synthetase [Lachnospiraceae bacterium]|nr:bifunctional riboflavin kinase/FAD synthetase [Lachnospiraceae bacterium]